MAAAILDAIFINKKHTEVEYHLYIYSIPLFDRKNPINKKGATFVGVCQC